jgi:hypothetical protein
MSRIDMMQAIEVKTGRAARVCRARPGKQRTAAQGLAVKQSVHSQLYGRHITFIGSQTLCAVRHEVVYGSSTLVYVQNPTVLSDFGSISVIEKLPSHEVKKIL